MAQISLHVDDDIKQGAERIFNDNGLSISTAINIFLKTVVRENRIPFEVSAGPFYSPKNTERSERSVTDANAGVNMTEHELAGVDERKKYGMTLRGTDPSIGKEKTKRH